MVLGGFRSFHVLVTTKDEIRRILLSILLHSTIIT